MPDAGEDRVAKLEKDLAEARQQLSGLSNERNAYRQKAEAWEKNVGSHLGDMLKVDPQTGLPTGVDPGDEPAPARTAAPTAARNPFSALSNIVDGFDPSAVDSYYGDLFKSQGFLTAQQAQEWANQAAQTAYQAARGDMLVMRKYDSLVGQDKYRELSNPDSDLAKRTARILQERKLAEPLNGAKTFDGWRYANLDVLQMGADLARLEMHEESLKDQQAGAAGKAAGMASGGAATAGPAVSAEQWEKALESGDVTGMKGMLGQQLGVPAG